MNEGHLHDVVVTHLHAEGVLDGAAAPPRLPLLERLYSRHETVVQLVLLIAVHRIVEEEREVRDEIEIVGDAVRLHLGQHTARALLPFAAARVAVRMATISRINRSKAIDETGIDGTLRRRLRGVPATVVPHE